MAKNVPGMGKFILRSFKILQLSVKLILEFDHILGLTVKLGFGEKLEGLWERNLRINSEGHLMWFSFSHALLLPWLLFHQRIIGDFLPPPHPYRTLLAQFFLLWISLYFSLMLLSRVTKKKKSLGCVSYLLFCCRLEI